MTHQDTRIRRLLTLALALGGVACGGTIDLDGAQLSAQASPAAMQDPADLADGSEAPFVWKASEYPFSIVADSTRLYWSTVFIAPSGFPDQAGAVRSCLLTDCTKSITTYISTPWQQLDSGVSTEPQLGLDGDNLYWLERDRTLMTCPVAGCDPTPRVVVHLSASQFLVDSHYIYSTNATDVLRCPLPLCEVTETVAHIANAHALTVHENDLFFSSSDTGLGKIYRAPKDGSSQPVVIAERWAETQSIAVSNDHVYWSYEQGSGAIFRCPITGCMSDPETFFGDEHPRNLLASPTELLWANASPLQLGYDATFRACPFTGCAPAALPLLQTTQYSWSLQSMAMLGARLFLAVQDCNDPAPHSGPAIRLLMR